MKDCKPLRTTAGKLLAIRRPAQSIHRLLRAGTIRAQLAEHRPCCQRLVAPAAHDLHKGLPNYQSIDTGRRDARVPGHHGPPTLQGHCWARDRLIVIAALKGAELPVLDQRGYRKVEAACNQAR